MSRLEDWRERGKALADRASEASRVSATDLTNQATHAAVDQGLRILSVASEQVREKVPDGPPVDLGLGLFCLEKHVQTLPGGSTSEPSLALRAALDPAEPGADGSSPEVRS